MVMMRRREPSEAVVARTRRVSLSAVPRRWRSSSEVIGKLRAVTEQDGYFFRKSRMAALWKGRTSMMRRIFPGKCSTGAEAV